MIRLPGWKPPVMLSRSSKPEGVPVIGVALERELLELVELGVQQLLDRAEVLARVLVGDLEDRALGHVHEVARERLVAVDLRLDLVRRVQQPAQHRVLAHDPRVLAQVADGRDRAGEQLDRRARRRRLQVARLLEVLDERQRVDGLALRVQVEHRLVDAPVALPVEVVRVEALVDDQRGQRRVRQQHRAEHGLLGLQVLGGAIGPPPKAVPWPLVPVGALIGRSSLGCPSDEHMFCSRIQRQRRSAARRRSGVMDLARGGSPSPSANSRAAGATSVRRPSS